MSKTPTIHPGYANDKRVERFKDDHYNFYAFCKPIVEVKKEIDYRELKMKEDILKLKAPTKEPQTFWEAADQPKDPNPAQIKVTATRKAPKTKAVPKAKADPEDFRET